MTVTTLATSTSGSEYRRSAMSAATRSIRGSTVLSTASPIRKKLNAPTANSASSVVSSRPRLPGVTPRLPEAGGEVGDRGDRLEHEVPDGPGELGQRAPDRLVVVGVDPVAHAPARLGVPAQVDQRDDPADHDDERAEREGAARHVGREPVDRAPEHEAEHAERDRPQAGGEHVVGQEPAQRHPRGAGDERHQRPHEAEEAPDDDHHRAALLEDALDLLEPLLGDLRAAGRARAASRGPSGGRARRTVTSPATHARPHDRDQRQQRDLALAGDQPADDHRGLARRDEPEERARLEERERADDEVGPLAERLAGVLEQPARSSAAGSRRRRSGRRAAIATSSSAWNQRCCLWRRTISQRREHGGRREPGALHAATARG